MATGPPPAGLAAPRGLRPRRASMYPEPPVGAVAGALRRARAAAAARAGPPAPRGSASCSSALVSGRSVVVSTASSGRRPARMRLGVVLEAQRRHAHEGVAQALRRGGALAVDLLHRRQPLQGGERGEAGGEGVVAGQVLDGPQAADLEVHRAGEPLAEAERRADLRGQLGEAGEEARVLGRLPHDVLQLRHDRQAAGQVPEVEADGGVDDVAHVVPAAQVHLERAAPLRCRHPPGGVHGRHAVRVRGEAALRDAAVDPLGQLLEVLLRPRVVGVGIGEPVVLVRDERHLVPRGAAEGEPGVGHGRRSEVAVRPAAAGASSWRRPAA